MRKKEVKRSILEMISVESKKRFKKIKIVKEI